MSASSKDDRSAARVDDTTRRRSLVESEILEQAAVLLAERGVAGLSLQTLADELGTSRPSLYYYVRSKEDLLRRLVDDIVDGASSKALEVIATKDVSPTERVRALVWHVAGQMCDNAQRFRALVRSESELPEDIAAQHFANRREILDAVTELMADGVSAGEFRPVDPRTAALGLIGMTNWIAWWYNPKVDDRDSICAHLADMAVASLTVESGRERNDAASMIELLREDLDRLERQLDTPH